MELDYSEEQRLLKDSAAGVFRRYCSVEAVRESWAASPPFMPRLWEAIGRLSWPGLLTAPPHGAGLSAEEAVVLLEETGRVLAPVPLSAALVAGWLISALGSAEQRDQLLPPLAAGQTVYAIAAGDSRVDRPGNGAAPWALVREAQVANKLLVPQSDGGEWRFSVVEESAIAERRPRVTAGQLREAAVTLRPGPRDDVTLAAVADAGFMKRLESLLLICEAAELTGACSQVLEMTIDHATKRHQFRRPIGSFQAVQHFCADMLIDLEGCRWMLWNTASSFAQGEDATHLSAALAVFSGAASQRIIRRAHQVHGGVGFIRDHPLHMYFGRQKAALLTWGLPAEHKGVLADALLGPREGG